MSDIEQDLAKLYSSVEDHYQEKEINDQVAVTGLIEQFVKKVVQGDELHTISTALDEVDGQINEISDPNQKKLALKMYGPNGYLRSNLLAYIQNAIIKPQSE